MSAEIFIIWGMHRAGTSLLAAAMRVFGAAPPDDAIAPDMFNPTGYFESRRLISLDDACLRALNMNWSSLGGIGREQTDALEEAGGVEAAADFLLHQKGTVVLKDPRMCKLGGLWRRAFRKAGITPRSILAWREPAAVAQSLARRDKALAISRPVRDTRYGQLLWLSYTLDAIRHTEGLPRALVSYDAFLKNPAAMLEGTGKIFSITPSKSALNDFCRDFMDKSLNHGQNAESDALPGKVAGLRDLLAAQPGPEFPENIDWPPVWPHTEEERILAAIIDVQARFSIELEKANSKNRNTGERK